MSEQSPTANERRTGSSSLRDSSVGAALQAMHPSYFALVMATGILSIGAELHGWRVIAIGLLLVNLLACAVLLAMLALRSAWFREAVWNDLNSHARGVGFFTMIAALCVLGTQFLVLLKAERAALFLWWVATVLWALLTYLILTLLTVRAEKPPLDRGVNGGWLVLVVAAQAVSLLGSQLAPSLVESRDAMLFFSMIVWLGGGMLYIWLITLIFFRYTFHIMQPGDLAPPYWINMGAMAISTLAGTFLISRASSLPLLEELLPFIKGATILFWATATWWIPMLLTLGFWRHVVRRYPLQYDPLYWGAVFPLGMYSVCTMRLAQALDLPYLAWMPPLFLVLGLIAWLATFTGMVRRCIAIVRDSRAATVAAQS